MPNYILTTVAVAELPYNLNFGIIKPDFREFQRFGAKAFKGFKNAPDK